MCAHKVIIPIISGDESELFEKYLEFCSSADKIILVNIVEHSDNSTLAFSTEIKNKQKTLEFFSEKFGPKCKIYDEWGSLIDKLSRIINVEKPDLMLLKSSPKAKEIMEKVFGVKIIVF
ncbi:MAG: hypothetical protein QW735_01475 [archaeon]